MWQPRVQGYTAQKCYLLNDVNLQKQKGLADCQRPGARCIAKPGGELTKEVTKTITQVRKTLMPLPWSTHRL